MTPEDLDRLARSLRAACTREPALQLAYLYGSAARGEPARDLDIGLYFDPPADARAAFAACERIAAAVEKEARPPLPLDVRPLNAAPPPLKHQVLTEGRRLYERSADERVVVEAEWASEWHDFQPFWDRQVARALRRPAR